MLSGQCWMLTDMKLLFLSYVNWIAALLLKGGSLSPRAKKPREESFVAAFIQRESEHFFQLLYLGMLREEKKPGLTM